VAVAGSLGRSSSTPEATVDLDGGLVSVSSSNRADYWRVAWRMVKAEPLSGMGAASWEAQWLRERPVPFHTRDAHNLYLETLAELGPVGLVLLLVTLALPFFALRVARLLPLGPAAGAALAAILLHAGVDWDWEIPVVIVAALFCAGVLLTSTREEPLSRLTGRRRAWVLGCALPLLAIALVAHVGNRAARASGDAAARGDARVALEQARRAIRWAPWSEQSWELRGEAELLLRRDLASRASLRQALKMNPESWSAWLDLAAAERGRQRAHALEQVLRLNPLSPEAEEVRAGFQTKG
jgi:tetratricopeptide (TPR) repeat protein